jgi:hypothetical protein
LVIVGVKQASEFSEEASVIQKEQLNINTQDTLYVSMKGNAIFSKQFGRNSNNFKPVYDENDRKLLYRTDVRFILKTTSDSLPTVSIDKNSRGRSYQNAKERAEKITYNYRINNNRLELDSYLTTDFENKFRDQQIEVTLHVPNGMILFIDKNTHSFHRNFYYSYYSDDGDMEYQTRIINNDDLLNDGMEGHYIQVLNNEIKCLDCPEEDFRVKVDLNSDGSEFKLDENGLRIKNDSNSIEINNNGVKTNSTNVKVNIDKNGIEITSDDN